MKTRAISFLALLVIAAPAIAAPGSVQDFQLPTPTPSATDTPQVQGPVDSQAGVPIGPRVIPTAAPTAAPTVAPTTAPTAAPTDSVATPAETPVPTQAAPAQTAPRTATTQRPATAPIRQAPATTAEATPPDVQPSADSPSTALDDLDFSSGLSNEIANAPAATSANGFSTPALLDYAWWAAALAAILAILGGVFFYRQRGMPLIATTPTIEPPLARREAEPSDEAPERIVAATTATQATVLPPLPVQLKAQALSLSRSMMNATLNYRLGLTNLGSHPLQEISIRANVVSAHGKAPANEQLADADSDLDFVSLLAEIKPGDNQSLDASFQIPISSIRAIMQRNAYVFVPLLRVRIEVEGKDPMIKTFVVGMKPAEGRGKLLPFRLDEMAQTYHDVGLRLLG